MKNKVIKKSLSIILVMAIVISTVCGSLISANAATAGLNYTIVGEAEAAGTRTATMTVTLTHPTGMQSGKFDLMFGGDVIDDANFGTKLNDKGETVPDYSNYLTGDINYPLSDLVGEKTETRVETTKVTNDFEWHKDTATATQWATSDPDGAESGWQSTGNTQTKDNWVKVDGSTQWATSDPPESDGEVWQATGNSKQEDNWTESTVDLRLSAVPADTATVKYVQGAKVQDNWSNTSTATKYIATNIASGAVVTTAQTAYTVSSGTLGNSATQSGTIPAANSTTRWVGTGNSKGTGFLNMGTTYYEVREQTNDPTYAYTKRVNTPVTTYEYQQYQNKPVTETEYQKYNKVYFETLVSYGASKLDTDKNGTIAAVDVYKTVYEPVYDENGNPTYDENGNAITTPVEKKNKNLSYTENDGNKGVNLPNAYDTKFGLWNTKIEITGGVRADGTPVTSEVISKDFTNDSYKAFVKDEGNTTNAIEGTQKINGVDYKYIYNRTDNYYTAHTNGNRNNGFGTDLLYLYYREYTTIDVATEDLGYSISTVSEDTVGSMPSCAQYAQGFKDITFNSSNAYKSITFTVTLDFTGNTDRASANAGVKEETLKSNIADGVFNGTDDGRYAAENYIGYGKKYQLNLINPEGDIAGIASVDTNCDTDFFHVHNGHINETVGKADPLNIEAIKAAGYEEADNQNYFNLYSSTCQVCKRVTPMLASTDLPYVVSTTNDNGENVNVSADKGAYSFNNYRNLSGINIVYKNDGSLAVNLHFPHPVENEQFIITDENGKVLRYSDVVTGKNDTTSIYNEKPETTEGETAEEITQEYNKADSFFACERILDENGQPTGAYTENLLHSSAKMITIENLSAKDIDKTLYIARYTPKSDTETELMGITHAISISDYCQAVIKDENVYYLNDGNGNISGLEDDHAADKKVAAALINYAAAAKTALATPNDTPTITEIWNGNSEVMSLSEAGTEDDPYIIENAEQLAWLVSEATSEQTHQKYFKIKSDIQNIILQKSGKDDIMALGSSDEVEAYFTNPENSITPWKTNDGENTLFCGHFDGSGATIYGMSVTNGALFSNVGIGASVKNVAVENSYCAMSGGNYASMVIGRVNTYTYNGETLANTSTYEGDKNVDKDLNGDGDKSDWVNAAYEKGYTNLKNIKIANCKIVCNNTDYDRQNTVGLLMGYGGQYVPAYISNCLVYGNKIEYTGKFTGINTVLIGFLDNDNPAINCGLTGCYIKNSLLLDTELVTSTNTHNDIYNAAGYTDVYTNVSTSADTITVNNAWGGTDTYTVISTSRVETDGALMIIENDDSVKGPAASTNLSELDWVNTFMCGADGEYPTLYHPDYKADVEGKTIFWSGSYNSDTNLTDEKHEYSTQDGTEENPIIIDNAEELASIALNNGGSADATSGKYFKIADGISKIILQPESVADVDKNGNGVYDILEADDVTDAKTIFDQIIDDNSISLEQWTVSDNAENYFHGNFDGNGVEIYGLYSSGNKNVGLFPAVAPYAKGTTEYTYTRPGDTEYTQKHDDNFDEGSIIKNVTVKNSYMSSINRIGGIVGVTPSQSYGRKIDSVIKIENCAIINCYMTSTGHIASSGVVIGAMGGGDIFEINNCLVYGNLATNSNGNDMTLFGSASTSYNVVDQNGKGDEANLRESTVKNTLTLGADPYCTNNANSRGCGLPVFKNVYTDSATKVTFEKWGGENGVTQAINYGGGYITHIDIEDLYGVGAKLAMPTLDWYDISTNPDGVWYYGHYTDIPSLKEIKNCLRAEDQAEYAAITFTPDYYDVNGNVHDDYGLKFGVYATSLNLKANPYIAFSFAFNEEYKENRDQIKIFIETKTTKYEVPEITAYDKENGKDVYFKNVNGWTHNENSGRYHIYRYTEIPVDELVDGVTITAHDPIKKTEVTLGSFSIGGLGYEFATANMKTPSKYYETRVEAMKALIYYAQVITERYGNR